MAGASRLPRVRWLLASLIVAAAAAGTLFNALPRQAHAQTPAVFYGPAASDSSVIDVSVDGAFCETAVVGADSSSETGFIWFAQIDAAECGAAPGSVVTFAVEGAPANGSLQWVDGGAPLNLPVGIILSTTPGGEVFAVTKTVDTDDGTCDADCSLREATRLSYTVLGPDTITLPGDTFTITIPGTGEDMGATGDLDLLDDLTITGAGVGSTILDGGGLDRVFDVRPGVNVTFDSLTITGGSTTGSGGGVNIDGSAATFSFTSINLNAATNGGGIHLSGSSTATISNSDVDGNIALLTGGGVDIGAGSAATFTFSGLAGNDADTGGAICLDPTGTLNFSNGTIDLNTAFTRAGGIHNAGGTFTISDSTISNNTASGGPPPDTHGGGIVNRSVDDGGTPRVAMGTFNNTTISGNAAGGLGGGIDNAGGTLTLVGVNLDSNEAGQGGALHSSSIDDDGTIFPANVTIGPGGTFVFNVADFGGGI